jgi:hypothetical protein
MAYKNIPGRPGWQFKDDPVNPGFKRSALHNKQTGGVRTTGLTQVYAERPQIQMAKIVVKFLPRFITKKSNPHHSFLLYPQ